MMATLQMALGLAFCVLILGACDTALGLDEPVRRADGSIDSFMTDSPPDSLLELADIDAVFLG